MDAISYSYADKAHKRIKKFINDPDSTSGVLTVPKTIAAGETITIPAGRVAILPNVLVDGDLVIDGEVFIPTGSMTSQVVQKVTSTDNAIVRFDGITGQVQNSSVTIDDSGNIGSGIQSFNGFGGSGFKNYIINGNFDIWQYGTSFSTTGFTADRWFITANVSSQRISLSPAETDLTGSSYALRFNAGTCVSYKIEDVRTLAGKKATLSFWSRSGASKTLYNLYIRQYFGIGGSAIVHTPFSSITFNNTTGLTKHTFTVDLPTIAGKTIGSDNTHYIEIFFESQNDGIYTDITGFQLEEGTIATPFENRPYGLELSLCQRYYERLIDFRYVTYMSAGNNVWISSKFSVPKRIAPTMNTVSATYANTTVISYYNVNTGHANIVCGATVSGQVGFVATIEASAEL
jgi:hypothetical protein